MSLRGIFWKKHFFPVPAPAIKKQEPFITGANLERAENYLKSLKEEKERLHEKWKSDKSVAPLFIRALVRYEGAKNMYMILTGTEETSEKLYRKVCDR